jgi:rhodanese-related sulfurtransferase
MMIREIGPSELSRLMTGSPPPLLLDVREPWELSLASLPQVVNIPMAQIPDRLEELAPDREIVVICHHGSRSLLVAAFLKQNGFDAVINLTGGIDAWSREVDPAVPIY